MGVGQAGAEGAHHGGQSLQVLLLASRRTGAHHFLRQWIACRASRGPAVRSQPMPDFTCAAAGGPPAESCTHSPEAHLEACLG